ncbi:Serine/threonine-protein kinase haspin [Dinochytrium kinnereticum]|nr:Serine/threonine-protein kinase haspin [Dinochytrium kinnereticum]
MLQKPKQLKTYGKRSSRVITTASAASWAEATGEDAPAVSSGARSIRPVLGNSSVANTVPIAVTAKAKAPSRTLAKKPESLAPDPSLKSILKNPSSSESVPTTAPSKLKAQTRTLGTTKESSTLDPIVKPIISNSSSSSSVSTVVSAKVKAPTRTLGRKKEPSSPDPAKEPLQTVTSAAPAKVKASTRTLGKAPITGTSPSNAASTAVIGKVKASTRTVAKRTERPAMDPSFMPASKTSSSSQSISTTATAKARISARTVGRKKEASSVDPTLDERILSASSLSSSISSIVAPKSKAPSRTLGRKKSPPSPDPDLKERKVKAPSRTLGKQKVPLSPDPEPEDRKSKAISRILGEKKAPTSPDPVVEECKAKAPRQTLGEKKAPPSLDPGFVEPTLRSSISHSVSTAAKSKVKAPAQTQTYKDKDLSPEPNVEEAAILSPISSTSKASTEVKDALRTQVKKKGSPSMDPVLEECFLSTSSSSSSSISTLAAAKVNNLRRKEENIKESFVPDPTVVMPVMKSRNNRLSLTSRPVRSCIATPDKALSKGIQEDFTPAKMPFKAASIPAPKSIIQPSIKATQRDLLSICYQTDPIPLSEALSSMELIAKLGEATFSEVFYYTIPILVPLRSLDFSPLTCVKKRLGDRIDESWPLDSRPVAVKIIPFDSDVAINGCDQQKVNEVFQEVQVARALSGFGGGNFVELLSVHVCHGPYPDDLLTAWDKYASERDSENDRPDILHPDQLYAALVLSNGGTSLEEFPLKCWAAARSVLLQAFLCIAQAERDLKFEHRDLHWGNLLCRKVGDGEKVYEVDGRKVTVALGGVVVTVIDYTVSRCEKDDKIFFVDMSDESYYTGEGDYQKLVLPSSENNIQFSYRMMRNETKGDWPGFYPKTNVMWMHYLIDKLLTQKVLPYIGASARAVRRSLTELKDRILGYGSAVELVEREVLEIEKGSFLEGQFTVESV